MTRLNRRFLDLVLYGDTTPTRLLLAAVAGVWSLQLFAPGDTFERPVYSYMALIASEHAWAAVWGCYSLALFWRTFSAIKHRLWLTMLINGVGVCLFVGATACIVFARVWPAPAATSGDIVLAAASIWLLMRSGLNSAPGWRND